MLPRRLLNCWIPRCCARNVQNLYNEPMVANFRGKHRHLLCFLSARRACRSESSVYAVPMHSVFHDCRKNGVRPPSACPTSLHSHWPLNLTLGTLWSDHPYQRCCLPGCWIYMGGSWTAKPFAELWPFACTEVPDILNAAPSNFTMSLQEIA